MRRTRDILAAMCFAAFAPSLHAAIPPKIVQPSFDCTKAKVGSIDKIICNSRELSILDRTMGQGFERAKAVTPRQSMPDLLQEQRAFIANRNKCMARKADRHDCIAFAYESRNQRLEEWIDGSAINPTD